MLLNWRYRQVTFVYLDYWVGWFLFVSGCWLTSYTLGGYYTDMIVFLVN